MSLNVKLSQGVSRGGWLTRLAAACTRFAAQWLQQHAWGRRMTVAGQVMFVAGLIAAAVIMGLNHRTAQLRVADTSTDSPGTPPSSVGPLPSQGAGPASGATALTSPHPPAAATRAVGRIPQLPGTTPDLPRPDIGSLVLPEMDVTVTWGVDAPVTGTPPGAAGQGTRPPSDPRLMTAWPAAVTVLALAITVAVGRRRRGRGSSQDRDATQAEPAMVEMQEDNPAGATEIGGDEEGRSSAAADVGEVLDPDGAAISEHSLDSADCAAPIASQDASGPLPGGTRDAEQVNGGDPERPPLPGAPPPDPVDASDPVAVSGARYSLTSNQASNHTPPAVEGPTRVLLFSVPHPEATQNTDLTDSDPLPAQPSVADGSIIRRRRTARVR